MVNDAWINRVGNIRLCLPIVGTSVDVNLFMFYALLGHGGCCAVGTRDLPRGQSRLDVDCSCASSIEVKTEWSYTFSPPFMACAGTKSPSPLLRCVVKRWDSIVVTVTRGWTVEEPCFHLRYG